jgi:hypothetical protein
MPEAKQFRLLREMQIGLDEEMKDASRKCDALAELVIEMLHALPLAAESKGKVMAALDRLLEAQREATADSIRRANRYRQILAELDEEVTPKLN